MMLSVGLIALGYVIAVCGVHFNPVMLFGLLVMLLGWFFLLKSGNKVRQQKQI